MTAIPPDAKSPTAAERAAEVLQPLAGVFYGITARDGAAEQVAALMADPNLLIACARQAVAEGATIDADAVVDLAIEAGALVNVGRVGRYKPGLVWTDRYERRREANGA